MQGVIRAVDKKLSFILVILLLPISKLNAIKGHVVNLINGFDHTAAFLLVSLFALSWAAAFIATLRGLSSIDNPSKHLNPIKLGLFYAAYYDFSLIDAYLNKDGKVSKKNINEIVRLLPNSIAEIEEELIFEQIKLSYIRGIKMIRQQYAYKMLVLWMLFGGIIWLLS